MRNRFNWDRPDKEFENFDDNDCELDIKEVSNG